jgi:hypothetical protein
MLWSATVAMPPVRPDRRRALASRRWLSWLVSIGASLAGAPAQVAPGGATGGFGWLSTREPAYRERFQQLLLAVPTRDWNVGWQLAADLGRPAVPLLWEMVQAEKSELGRRLTLLVAAVVAGGPGEDDRLLLWLDRQKPMLQERVMAAMLVALGPRRPRPVADFWPRFLGPDKSPEHILAIAVRLAAARFPGTETGAPPLLDDEPGLAAAAAFAGLPIPAPAAARLSDLRAPARHAELFWRGLLLRAARAPGEAAPGPEQTGGRDRALEFAQEVSALTSDDHFAARAAAALARVRAGLVRADGPRPDWGLLLLLASEGASARAVQAWLPPVPSPRDEEPRRLAVAYVLSRQPAVVLEERNSWGGDARVRGSVALALAWLLLGEERPTPNDVLLPGVPEWFLVRWASGAEASRTGPIDDPVLDTAAVLAAGGRLSRAVARRTIEEALWRLGSHPGLAVYECDRLLVRDLLLVGSHPGGNKYVPHLRAEQRYRPTGIGPDHVFFEVAVAAFDFLARPRLPIPHEYRLR